MANARSWLRRRISSTSPGSTTSTIPTPMLNVENMSASDAPAAPRTSSKIGGSGQEPRRMRAPNPGGSARGMFSTNPPPVMWAAAWSSPSCASDRTSGA